MSLTLHLVMGVVLLYFFVPQMTGKAEGGIKRYSIALARVLPTLPAAEAHPIISDQPGPVFEKRESQTEAAAPVRKTAVPEKRPEVAVSDVPPLKEAAATEHAPAEPETAAPAIEMSGGNPEGAEWTEETVQREASEAVPEVRTQNGTEYMDEHLGVIARLLQEHLRYPLMARKRHIEGEVVAVFRIETDGTVHDIVVKQHAHNILDRAALRTIESLSGLLPHPENPLTLEVPIRFVLK